MGSVLFRPFMETPEKSNVPKVYALLKNPLFAWAGVRPVFAQHTFAEDQALRTWARNREIVVEIGVAEGGSALALKSSMFDSGALYLIDPYHLSRVRWINGPKRAAHSVLKRFSHAATGRESNVKVTWIEDYSFNAVKSWNQKIDFLFLDGNHDESAVRRDWEEWHGFVAPKGIVAFHDARMFRNGWPTASDGPVKIVNALFREQNTTGWKIVDETHSIVFLEKCE
jgi:predicted O-methyltransferase YrrM